VPHGSDFHFSTIPFIGRLLTLRLRHTIVTAFDPAGGAGDGIDLIGKPT
jgi:hypothetical protein